MKYLAVSDEMYEKLMELSKELNTQDHRHTAMPYLFQIEDVETIPAYEGCDGFDVWYSSDHELELTDDEEINQWILDTMMDNYPDAQEQNMKDKISEMDGGDIEDYLEEHGFTKYHSQHKKVYKNGFLTAKACQDHIDCNRHHYSSGVRTFLTCAWRNPELELVMKFLCEISGGEIHR